MRTRGVISALLAMILILLNSVTGFAYDEIPSQYDSRKNGVITPVKNQGGTGACWAFATISAIETDAINQGLVTVENADFSEAHLAWFTYTRATDVADPLCGEGWWNASPYGFGANWSRAAGTLAKWSGVAEESAYPFDETALGDYDESGRYDRSAGLILNDVEILTSRASVKKWIMEHGSCTATILWSMNYENTETSSYYYNGTIGSTNHMITLVGWDDNYPASAFLSEPPTDGAWLVKDSYGTEHHDAGYYHLSYNDKNLSAFAGFSVRPSTDFDTNYTYNGAGFSPCMQHTNGAVAANIFETKCDEQLKAVSLYTANPGTETVVRVYTGLDENTVDLTECECVYETAQTFENQGYHTLDLPEPVELGAHTRFAVAVTYSHPDGKVYIPVERLNQESGGCAYKYQKGQSVCLFKDKNPNWCDASARGVGNFYIQAFTVREKTELKLSGDTSVYYRFPAVFKAEAKNVFELEWYTDAQDVTVSEDGTCTVNEPRTDFEIYCEGKDADGNPIVSETIKVEVKSGVFYKFLYWFVKILRIIYAIGV